MCGIAGVWYNTSIYADKTVIKKMTDAIVHRGPDGDGFWYSEDNGLLLGHRRLSIIDLSINGSQPMKYRSRYVITYNGEIYNYLELKDLLTKKGYRFFTATDTEVIMAAYDFWGIQCLKYFDGMFAFCLYDNEKDLIFCARDRFGEKPFHYAINKNLFMFGSEMKSLWAAGVDKTIDDYSMYLFLNFELHEDPTDKTRTFFKHIKRLKPGHYFIYQRGKEIKQEKYWEIKQEINTYISFDEACLKFKEMLFSSIKLRLRSDVAIGTSLSGGLDSSSVALVMNQINKNSILQKSFSARFDDASLDEGFYMNKVVENRNIEHFSVYPQISNLVKDIEKIIYHQEEPFAGASISAQWEVFKLAKENGVTVLLDGQGADEVFAGYTHFFKTYFREIYLKNGRKALNVAYNNYLNCNIVKEDIKINKQFLFETKFHKAFYELRILKQKLVGVNSSAHIHPDLKNAFKNNLAPFNTYVDLNASLEHYTSNSGLDKLLRFADRNSMAHSVEVRLPFLSHELVEFAFTLPSEYKIREGWTKAIIRHGLNDILPDEIAWRKNKLGFQPPQKEWETDSEFIKKAKYYQQIAVENKYIKPNANFIWNGFMAGVFINLTK
ncbi:MAG: asparagine synthase (glutamine-hydrolyzing) [Bacteroidetes bacterium GWF2_33_38]|nr:MAG: asparagine synthase (glutamine-hydrolyzing) [Bacteroidetes bacterium GWF2_33_38]OFY73217.1 MAG: asparagine synthase (glutamine-hydrolyzing) [Bacteroidetes bacterium RIFOXYA12_FULL_33_9]OFY88665.1 MAG: asparagine synthase (glutamine-hydrolyzing) [Bacteroidetes bacterium RIFOXYA2_FULL_33_7]